MPLFQSEAKSEAFEKKNDSNAHLNKTHIHKKGLVLGPVLKVGVIRTQNWPIVLPTEVAIIVMGTCIYSTAQK